MSQTQSFKLLSYHGLSDPVLNTRVDQLQPSSDLRAETRQSLRHEAVCSLAARRPRLRRRSACNGCTFTPPYSHHLGSGAPHARRGAPSARARSDQLTATAECGSEEMSAAAFCR